MDNRYDIGPEEVAVLTATDLIDLADILTALTTLNLAIDAAVNDLSWGLVQHTPGAKDIWLNRAKNNLLAARTKATELTGVRL